MNVYKELENPQLAKRLMELFCEGTISWICDEMGVDSEGNKWCANNCEYSRPVEECVVRYIKMQFRQEGVDA